MPEAVIDRSDIVVDAPLDRDQLRQTDEAILTRCTSHHCEWEGLFPTPELAIQAANAHLYRERRDQDIDHVGDCGAWLIELDGDRGRMHRMTNHVHIGAIGPRRPLSFDDVGFGPWYPRTRGDVDALVQRGDRIELSGGREAKVAEVRQTRAGGIATWSVVYADIEADITGDDWQPKYQNELVARDGNVYCRYGEDFLGVPVFEVVGEADHQADFSEFGGGASA